MAARDKYDIDIACPHCLNKGKAGISENDYPFMRSRDARVQRLPNSFKLVSSDESNNKAQVLCLNCDSEFTFSL